MRKILALCLVLCVCFSLCACGMEIDIDLDARDDDYVAPVITEPTYDPPSDNDAILQYLTDKYGCEFEHKKYDDKQSTLYYTSTKYPHHLFKVCTIDAIWMAGHDISLFEGEYADNGYFAVSYNEAYKHYWDLISYIPECSMLIDYDGEVVPSCITPDTPFAEAKKQYPELFTPTLYILREQQLSNKDVENLKMYLEHMGEELIVYIVVADKTEWSTATIEKLYDDSKTFTIRQFFETHPEASGN